MISKQDGVATRTAADLERKYSFGKTFAEVMGYATDAQNAAEIATEAAREASKAVDGLDQEEIFNRLTNNGQAQGIYRDPDTGEIYVNASYLATGVITSADGTVRVDLGNGTVSIDTTLDGRKGKVVLAENGINGYGWNPGEETYQHTLQIYPGVYNSEVGSGYATSITNPSGTVGMTLSGGKDATTAIGNLLGDVNIYGKTIKFNGTPIDDSLFTTTPLTLTQADQTNYTVSWLYAYARSGVVDLHFSIKPATAATSWITVATLPEGYRPPQNIYKDVPHWNVDGGYANLRMRITTAGAIQFNRGSADTSYAFHDTFIIA